MRCYTWSETFTRGAAIKPVPGDLILIDAIVRGQWPPDGVRSFAPDGMAYIEPLTSIVLNAQHLAILISIEVKYAWLRIIILHEGRLWWIPVSKMIVM